MPFLLEPLPYPADAIARVVGPQTVRLHHGAHQRGYVDALNAIVEGKPEERMTLEEIIQIADGPLFDNAAQVWNHAFYWRSMRPGGGGEPEGMLRDVIRNAFGSVEALRAELAEAALLVFGSGWAWLVKDRYGRLEVQRTDDADNPLREEYVPLAAIDCWEHAYYLDHQHDRARYVQAWLDHGIDWFHVGERLQLAGEADLEAWDRERGLGRDASEREPRGIALDPAAVLREEERDDLEEL